MRTNRNNWQWLTILLVLTIMLVACGGEEPTPTPAPEEPTPVPEEPTPASEEAEPAGEAPAVSQPIYRWGEVADRLWVLVGYGDAANPTVVDEGTVITAVFSSVEPTVSGSGGCNNYFANYESTDEGGLTITGPIGSTMMACEDTMDTEAAYFAALETVSGWSLTEEGRLELTYDTGEPFEQKLVYAPGETPLVGTTWQLVSFGDPDDPQEVLDGTSVTAVFSPETDTTGTVGGNATCNGYSTSYTIDGDQISFGPIAGTLMMCPIGADQEQAYLAALESAQTFQIIGANMQITYDGGVLNYTSLNLPLENVLWQAVMVVGQLVPEGVEITALFTPGEEAGIGNVGGNAGCNSYNTSYETSSDLSTNPTTHFLTISSPMAMTMAICPEEELANLEMAYIAALETAETYEILGDQLVIHSADGDIQYTADRQPLLGTQWALTSLGNVEDPQPPVEGSNFTAQFNRLPTLPSGTVTGETGCNDYNATFTANLNEIKINLPSKTQNEDCPWGAGNFEVEQQFFLALNSATEYRILGNVLQIPYGEEQVLNFVATQPEGEEAIDLTPLADTFWYLLSIGDNALIPYTEITAAFEVDEGGLTGTISGSGGCNAYNAAIGENFAVGPIASTQRACAEEVMEQEGGYLDWLGQAYDYTRAGDQLLISTANGVLTYNSTPVLDQTQELQEVTWYLVSAGNLTAVPGSGATTIFASDGQSVSGNTGCNEFNGSYNTEPGNQLTISGFASTQAACPTDALARQEEALLIFLQSATNYTVIGTSMQIQTVDGSVINYTSIPPVQVGAPTAVISGPEQADTGELLTFDGSGSLPMGSPIVAYDWDMGDGTVLSGVTVQYSYNTANSYNVQLTVTTQAGATDTASQAVLVRPVVEVEPPTAAIEGPAEAFVGEQVTFSAAGSQQGTEAIASYTWQSGDGNNIGPISENSFTTVYSRPGTYYPTVTVADANGLSDSASMAITVNANLEGTDWILNNTLPGTTISLVFANGNLSGFAGCNSYNASYSSTRVAGPSNNITVGPVISTGALCSEEINAQEQDYLTNLESATSYTISGT
ncbi:MAG: META domain-containing protein, partial [Chloroflexota bacterium]